MAKYDYQDLREEVERWSSAETDALDRREHAQSAAYDEDPEGRYFDTIGDTAGQHFHFTRGKRDELLALIARAEMAERDGNVGTADQLVTQIYRNLREASALPAPRQDPPDPAAEFDPEPPDIPDISLLAEADHDYEALLRAVDRWQEAEEREIDRWEKEHEREFAADPVNKYADTIGEGAGIQFRYVHSRADDFRAQVRRAATYERHGDMQAADRLVAEVRNALGIRDDAMPQIEAYLFDAAYKSATRRRMVALVWAIVGLLGVAAALFGILG